MKVRSILPGNRGHHAVTFYSDEHRLCVSVADFLADGIAAGQPTLVIATPQHRARIFAELTARRFDLAALVHSGSVMLLDAQETLDQFMVNDRPDPARFREVLGAAIERVCRNSNDDAVVRAYGEMVDVLWGSDKREAAIALEILWNELAKTHSFSLMCGYAMGSFFQQASGQADVCAHHTHVHDASGV